MTVVTESAEGDDDRVDAVDVTTVGLQGVVGVSAEQLASILRYVEKETISGVCVCVCSTLMVSLSEQVCQYC